MHRRCTNLQRRGPLSEGSSTAYGSPAGLQLGGSDAARHRGSAMKAVRRGSFSIASLLLAGVTFAAPALAADEGNDRCAGARDIKLVNGRIHTLDGRNSIVSSVTIKNGKFAAVGLEMDDGGGPCMRVINLGGRTAVPGLVDNHNHFLLLGLRPGHDTRLETARSIA